MRRPARHLPHPRVSGMLSSASECRVREYGRLIWCPRLDEFREQNRIETSCATRRMSFTMEVASP
jgi:hypothetical protein